MDEAGSKYDGCDTLYTYEAAHLLDMIRDLFIFLLSFFFFLFSFHTSQVVRA